MRIQILILISITVLMTDVFGKDYTNEEYGIHFIFPDHWKIINYEELPLEKRQILDNKYHPFKTLSICGIKNQDGSNLAQLVIQYKRFEKSSFDEAKSFVQTKQGKEMMITSAKINVADVIGDEIKQYKITETGFEFIDSVNRACAIVCYERSDKSKIIAMEVKFICKDGSINLCCFSKGSETDRFVDTVNKIADSFEYNRKPSLAIKTTETPNSSDLNAKQTFKGVWKWAGIILTISVILGIIRMLFSR